MPEPDLITVALLRTQLTLEGIEPKEFAITIPTNTTNVTYQLRADNMAFSDLRLELSGCGSHEYFVTVAGGELSGSLCDEAEAGAQALTFSGRYMFEGEFALFGQVPDAVA